LSTPTAIPVNERVVVYAPEPPVNSGTPERAPPAILAYARQSYREITARR
jgi:cyclohexyl-isocyanide hydratase